MQGLIEFVKTLGPTRLVAMAAVTAALIGFFALLIMRAAAPMMVPLFTELTIEGSSASCMNTSVRLGPAVQIIHPPFRGSKNES